RPKSEPAGYLRPLIVIGARDSAEGVPRCFRMAIGSRSSSAMIVQSGPEVDRFELCAATTSSIELNVSIRNSSARLQASGRSSSSAIVLVKFQLSFAARAGVKQVFK